MEETIEESLPLNPDCWIAICDLLDWREVLKLAKVSTAFKKFLQREVLPMKLKELYIRFEHESNWRYIDEEDFKTLLDSVWPTVKGAYLMDLTDKQFELLQLYRFPCVASIDITLARPMNDIDMRVLSEVFPNLRSFEPQILCSSPTIASYRNLKDLKLTYCRQMPLKDFQSILLALNLTSLTLGIFKRVTPLNREAQLKLSQLEELKLNSHELSWVSEIGESIIFENLKVLGMIGKCGKQKCVEKLFRNMKRIVTRDVYELEFAKQNVDFLCKFVMPEKYDFLNKIRTLKLVGFVLSKGILRIPGRLIALRELHLYGSMPLSEVIPDIVANSEELDLLSFELCDMPNLDETCLYTLRWRKNRLRLNWYANNEGPYSLYWPDIYYEKYGGVINFERQSLMSTWFDPMTIRFE